MEWLSEPVNAWKLWVVPGALYLFWCPNEPIIGLFGGTKTLNRSASSSHSKIQPQTGGTLTLTRTALVSTALEISNWNLLSTSTNRNGIASFVVVLYNAFSYSVTVSGARSDGSFPISFSTTEAFGSSDNRNRYRQDIECADRRVW